MPSKAKNTKKSAKAPKRRGKSRAESMTGAKEAAVEVRQASFELVIIESGDFQMHFKAIKAAKEKHASTKGVLDACRKAAKRLNPYLPAAIDRAIAIERKPDPQAIKAELEVYGIALRETDCPIQISIFDTLAGDTGDQAYRRGEADGLAGRSAESPFPEGSDLHARYVDGWQHGMAKNAAPLAPKDGKNGNGRAVDDGPSHEPSLPLEDSVPREAEQTTSPLH